MRLTQTDGTDCKDVSGLCERAERTVDIVNGRRVYECARARARVCVRVSCTGAKQNQ